MKPRMTDIALEVAGQYRLTLDDLKGPRRRRREAWPRQELMWRLSHEGGRSLPQIGAYLNRDHTTVLHGVRRHAERAALQ